MSWAQLNKKEVPYLITLFVAIVGWSITHVADRVLKSPVVEYTINLTTTTDPHSIRVTVLNLSNQAFTNLRFELQGQGLKACNLPIAFEPPAWASNSAPDEGTYGVSFLLSQLQPNWKVTVCGLYKGEKVPAFVLKDAGTQSIELKRPDLATCILKYEALLMVALAALAFLGILAWILFASETK